LKIHDDKAGMPTVGDRIPRRDTPVVSMLGRWIFRVAGWRFESELPNVSRGVIIFGPHTSNWDFVFGMAVILTLRIKATWIGKHTLFKRPFGGIFRWLGGIPIDRRASQGMIGQMIDTFRDKDKFFLVLAPEGSRKKVRRWKSGFYYIALGAGVPILVACLDYANRLVTFSPLIDPSGDYEADLKMIQAIVAGKKGKKAS
jgi:1-acyl-sn-glycerol-3-phosphate acyltransferase